MHSDRRGRRASDGLRRGGRRARHRAAHDDGPPRSGGPDLAEREGFEPPVPTRGTAVFETAPFNHSGTSPSGAGAHRSARDGASSPAVVASRIEPDAPGPARASDRRRDAARAVGSIAQTIGAAPGVTQPGPRRSARAGPCPGALTPRADDDYPWRPAGGPSSNGRTTGSGPVGRGSNPCGPTTLPGRLRVRDPLWAASLTLSTRDGYTSGAPMTVARRLMAGQLVLVQSVGVRIPAGQPPRTPVAARSTLGARVVLRSGPPAAVSSRRRRGRTRGRSCAPAGPTRRACAASAGGGIDRPGPRAWTRR